MDKNNVKELRELTRILERNLELLNHSDCCTCNITTAQCHALVEIGRNKDLMLKDLAAILRIDISTASKVVEELVKKEMVLRQHSMIDRRSIQINLTEKAQSLFEKIESDMDHIFEQTFALIGEDDRETLLKSLKVYNQAIEKLMGGYKNE